MLASNIWKYAIFLVSNKRIFVAILSVYYLTIQNTTIQDVGLIMLIGNLAGFLFEIPSGYISDKVGHKKTLIFSRIFMLASTICFLLASNFYLLILGSVFTSLAFAFASGTGSAFMHETLTALGREKEFNTIMGKIRSIGFFVPILLMTLIPFLVSISYKLPFLISLFTDFIGLITAISFVSPKIKPEKIKEITTTNFKQVIKKGKETGFLSWSVLLAFVSGASWALSGFRAPYQEFVGLHVIYFGVLLGVGRLLASIILFYTGKIQKYFTLESFIKLKILIYIVFVSLLGIFDNMYSVAIVFILMNGLKWGTSQITSNFMIEKISKTNFKATLLSVKAQISQVVRALFAGGVGFLIHKTSYQTGFIVLAFIILSVYIVLMATLKKR